MNVPGNGMRGEINSGLGRRCNILVWFASNIRTFDAFDEDVLFCLHILRQCASPACAGPVLILFVAVVCTAAAA